MPFFRDLALSLGGCSSSAASIRHIIGTGSGKIGSLVVGGAQESFFCRPGQYKFILHKRKGFVKLALQTGAPLVPVISFGETDLFDQLGKEDDSMLRRIQEKLRKVIGLAPVIPVGRGLFQYTVGLVPRRKPVTTVGEKLTSIWIYMFIVNPIVCFSGHASGGGQNRKPHQGGHR